MKGRVFGYRLATVEWLIPALLVGFAAVGLPAMVAIDRSHRVGVVVVLQILVIWLIAYRLFWQLGTRIEVDGTRVVWRGILRRRQVDLLAVTGNRSIWPFTSVLDVRGEAPLRIRPRTKDWRKFLAALNAVHPARPFEPTKRERRRFGWSRGRGFYLTPATP